MADRNLILFASVDGQTRKISEVLGEELAGQGQEVELRDIREASEEPALMDYDRIVIGSSIRYGVHNKELLKLIKRRRDALDRKKTAFFSVNLVARKAEKSRPETNPYVVKFFRTIDWRPTVTEVFAGKLEYPKYGFFDRLMIRMIMYFTKGPTDPKTVIEYTDWEKVKAFGQRLGQL